jgi:signal transduction histidine kinase
MEAPLPDRLARAPWSEIARLLAIQRLALGAAHAMNNAFTAILGETGYLRDEHKGDPELLESCGTIHSEVSRCARLTRALLALGRTAASREDEIDLVGGVRSLASLLGETLGRHVALELETPDALIRVHGSPRLVEPLLVLLVHHALEEVPGCRRVRVSVEPPREGRARVSVVLAQDAGPRTPEPGAARPGGLLAAAIGAVVEEIGATLEVGTGPDGGPCWWLGLATAA